MRWSRGGVSVRWVRGGLYVEAHGHGVLLDCPPAAVDELTDVLPRIREVVLTGGRLRSAGGLTALLVALERHRVVDVPLPLHFPLGDERPSALAEAFVRGWPDRYPVQFDAELPGTTFDVGPLEIHTFASRRGEPRWLPTPEVRSVMAQAVRVVVGDVVVAFVPGAPLTAATRRAVQGADLAVVEVGVEPWPHSDVPFRSTLSEALTLTGSCGELWIVGDDGHVLDGGEPN